MRKFTVKDPSAKRPKLVRVMIEQSKAWHGFGSAGKMFHSEAKMGDEYLVVCYDDVYLKTPYHYEVKVNRRNVDEHGRLTYSDDTAHDWLRTRLATLNLGHVAVNIDSIQRIITITTTPEAEVIEE